MEWYLLILISAFIFGVSEVFKKKVLYHEHTLQFVSSYFLMCFIFLLVLLPRVNFYISSFEWLLIIMKSAFLALAAFMIFKLLRHYDISEIIPLKNLSPLFLVVFGYLMLHEAPSIINILGILLLVIGTYIIEADHRIVHLKKPLKILKDKKILFLLVYLVFISFCAIIDKFVLRTVDIYSYYFLQTMLVTAIFLAFKALKKGGLSDIRSAFKKDWPTIIIASLLLIVSDVLYLQAIAIPATLVVLAIPMKRISTIVAAFLGGELFHEKSMGMKLTACLIMVIGASLVIL